MKHKLLLAAVCCTVSAILLSSCTQPQTLDYFNGTDVCQLGETIYERRFTQDLEPLNLSYGYIENLCRDPLCQHDYNTVCPVSDLFAMQPIVWRTDGRQLYMMVVNNQRWMEEKAPVYEIYELDAENGSMKLIHSYIGTSNIGGDKLEYSEGWLYYEQGYYNESYDSTSGYTDHSDQYMRIMRVKTSGGEAEEVLDESFSARDRFFVDELRYYIISDDGTVRVIDRESGAEAFVTEDDCRFTEIVVYRDETYFIGSEPPIIAVNAEENIFYSYRVYRYDGELTLIAENCAPAYDFSEGAFWYSQFELTFLGTKDMPTGRGSEKVPRDQYRQSSGELVRVDLSDGSTSAWRHDDFDDGMGIAFKGMRADGYAVLQFGNAFTSFENDEPSDDTLYLAVLNDDGGLTVCGTLDGGQQKTETVRY